MNNKECNVFSLKDVTVSALGLAVALPWTEAIKGGMTKESILLALTITIIVQLLLSYCSIYIYSRVLLRIHSRIIR